MVDWTSPKKNIYNMFRNIQDTHGRNMSMRMMTQSNITQRKLRLIPVYNAQSG